MAENGIVVSQPQLSGLNMFANQDSFNTGYKMAQILSASTIVPKTFQGNIGNTMIAIDIAQRLHTNPLMIMQKQTISNQDGKCRFTMNYLGRNTKTIR